MELLRIGGSNEAQRKKLVGITFDDGPNPENILEILQLLNALNTQATFFWIVENASQLSLQRPALFHEMMQLIKTGNHEVGLHAPHDYRPTLFTRLYGAFTKAELKQAKDELEELTGNAITLYRPHILLQPTTIFFARQMGLTTVIGNIGKSYADAAAPVERQVRRFSNAQPGSILIMHDGISYSRQSTFITEVLPQVISNLQKKGLIPTKVSNIL